MTLYGYQGWGLVWASLLACSLAVSSFSQQDVLLPKTGTPSDTDKKRLLEPLEKGDSSSQASAANTTEPRRAPNGTVPDPTVADGGKSANDTISTEDPDDEDTKDPQPPIRPFDEWTKEELEKQQLNREQKIIEQQQQIQAQSGGNGATIPEGGAAPKTTDQGGAVGDPGKPGGNGGQGGTPQVPTVVTHRNYASKECGAKILNTNPEAQNAKAILNEKDRDEYLINPCSMEGKKFFVVELCETIQPTRFEMANFELFSSSPKDFVLWGSERYPTNEWTQLGTWEAADQREIQGFEVAKRGIYAKFIKIDLTSHYGSEHFCPLSLIRIFGISFVEEFEGEAITSLNQEEAHVPVPSLAQGDAKKEDSKTNDTTEADKGGEGKKKDFIGSAKDAVAHLAKGVIDKAQELLGAKKEHLNHTACQQNNSASVGENFPFWLQLCYTCKSTPTFLDLKTWSLCHYFAPKRSLMPYEHLVEEFMNKNRHKKEQPASTKKYGALEGKEDGKSGGEGDPEDQQGVGTEWKKEAKGRSGTGDETLSEGGDVKGKDTTAHLETQQDLEPDQTDQNGASITPATSDPSLAASPSKNYIISTSSRAMSSRLRLEKLLRQLREKAKQKREGQPPPTPARLVVGTEANNQRNGTGTGNGQAGAGAVRMPGNAGPAMPGPSYSSKESVFIKLNNRIKSLELNISMSSRYLSELSRNYKKQMEDIQRQYNRTLRNLNETRRKTEEGDAAQSVLIGQLREEVELMAGVIKEMKKGQAYFYEEFWKYHAILLFAELAFLLLVVWCCSGGRANRQILIDAVRQELRARPSLVLNGHAGGPIPNGCLPHASHDSGDLSEASSNLNVPPPTGGGDGIEDVDFNGELSNSQLLNPADSNKRRKKKKNKHTRSDSDWSKSSSTRTETPPLSNYLASSLAPTALYGDHFAASEMPGTSGPAKPYAEEILSDFSRPPGANFGPKFVPSPKGIHTN